MKLFLVKLSNISLDKIIIIKIQMEVLSTQIVTEIETFHFYWHLFIIKAFLVNKRTNKVFCMLKNILLICPRPDNEDASHARNIACIPRVTPTTRDRGSCFIVVVVLVSISFLYASTIWENVDINMNIPFIIFAIDQKYML